jgi:hypothetical protein
MPVATIPGSGGSTPVDLYKVRQTKSDSKQTETSRRPSQQEDAYSVAVSQEALALQKQNRARQAEFEQQREQNLELRTQTDRDLLAQRAEAADRAKQQTIDIVI